MSKQKANYPDWDNDYTWEEEEGRKARERQRRQRRRQKYDYNTVESWDENGQGFDE